MKHEEVQNENASVPKEGHDQEEVVSSNIEIVFRHFLFLWEWKSLDREPLDVANLALGPWREDRIRRDTGNQVQADRLEQRKKSNLVKINPRN